MAHAHEPEAGFDGGDLDCGNGLLLLIRKHIDPLLPGELLEILSSEPSVEEDLPAWCRLTGNELVSTEARADRTSYLVSKGAFVPSASASTRERPAAPLPSAPIEVVIPSELPAPAPAPAIPPQDAAAGSA